MPLFAAYSVSDIRQTFNQYTPLNRVSATGMTDCKTHFISNKYECSNSVYHPVYIKKNKVTFKYYA